MFPPPLPPHFAAADEGSASLYPAPRNARYQVDGPLTAERLATTYNNFYEFGSHKDISRAAQALRIRPWAVRIDGLVEREMIVDIDTLLRSMPLEERVYRHRCVEAWSMTVPWSGFPMSALLDLACPLAAARYVEMHTFSDPEVAPGQHQAWYPWPYVEGLTIQEAANELTFLATGIYGEPLPKQNGAPLRLAVPWKYGFKSVKSIVRLRFTDARPRTFWDRVQPREYGFWANVNPNVPHARWSQSTERVLGTNNRVPTRLFNGYAEFVHHLYDELTGERLFT
jgi:sulfoxide reductase catalytic subunit YedY